VKAVILILISFLCFAEVEPLYRGQTKSLIDWQGMDAQSWLDIGKWKEKSAFKDRFIYWESLERIQKLKEPVGRVLDCFGDCRLFRENGEHRVRHMSEIMEADEILTYKNSYLWVFLYDGTLVRLAPESSVTVKEINISNERIFLHARLNIGNILWLSRHKEKIKTQKMRETDTVFFPMALYEANPLTRDGNITLDEYLFGDEDVVSDQYTRVNKFIEKNNAMVSKKTETMLVLPSGTVYGEELSLEAYVSIAGDNLFKLRADDQLYLEKEKPRVASLNLRGYINKNKTPVDYGVWYKIPMPGRTVEEMESTAHMNINELLTRRIPSIYFAREMMFEKYSRPIFDKKISPMSLAQDHGYRAWSSKEIDKRLDFLWGFSRRLETSNLAVAERFRDEVLKKHNKKDKAVVRPGFFELALAKYLERGEVDREKFYNPKLNSEKKQMWKRINGIRSKTKISFGIGEPEKKGTTGVDESSTED
jgi:hypothetical protein